MTSFEDAILFERRQFFDEQRLFADDLNDRESYHRALRWLHNQSLHQPGIGNGYAVIGAKGDREVAVGPGYALDARGREIVLARSRKLPVPPVAADEDGNKRSTGCPVFYYLAVSYPDDAELTETEFRQGLCAGGGAVRLAEEPTLCWVRLGFDEKQRGRYTPKNGEHSAKIDSGMMIVLARVQVFQCHLNEDVEQDGLAVRRSARPARLPFIASGIASGAALWSKEAIPGLEITTAPAAAAFPLMCPAPYRLRATVTTDSKRDRFVAIPRYLVRVSGERIYNLGAENPTTHLPTPPAVYLEPDIDVQLDPTLTNHIQFTVLVTVLLWIPSLDALTMLKALDYVPKLAAAKESFFQGWSIEWAGIEG